MTGVVLVRRPYAQWVAAADGLRARVAELLPGAAIEHIGSTAVPGLPAKPVVDLLVGVRDGRVTEAAAVLEAAGFDLEGQRAGHGWSMPDRRARDGVVHVMVEDGDRWRRKIAFRDLLRSSEVARERHLEVKLAAAASSQGWADYTEAKASVVEALLAGQPPGATGP